MPWQARVLACACARGDVAPWRRARVPRRGQRRCSVRGAARGQGRRAARGRHVGPGRVGPGGVVRPTRARASAPGQPWRGVDAHAEAECRPSRARSGRKKREGKEEEKEKGEKKMEKEKRKEKKREREEKGRERGRDSRRRPRPVAHARRSRVTRGTRANKADVTAGDSDLELGSPGYREIGRNRENSRKFRVRALRRGRAQRRETALAHDLI